MKDDTAFSELDSGVLVSGKCHLEITSEAGLEMLKHLGVGAKLCEKRRPRDGNRVFKTVQAVGEPKIDVERHATFA